MAFIQFLANAFIVDDIDIDGHTNTKHQCTDAGKCEGCPHQRIDTEYCPDIEHQHDAGKNTRQTVSDDHEQHDQGNADSTGNSCDMQRIFTILGGDNIGGNLRQLDWQRTGVDQVGQCLGLCFSEIAGNDAVTADG